MNKTQREVYVALAETIEWSVCSFCKFWHVESCGGWGDCKHPLEDKVGLAYKDLLPGDDCWAFRPVRNPSITADIVGIVLSEGWERATWYENKEGQLVIVGSKEAVW